MLLLRLVTLREWLPVFFKETAVYLEDESRRFFRNVVDYPQDCKVSQIDHSANIYLRENFITFLLSSVVNI